MGFEPLVWYCQPVEGGIWATVTDSAFGAYTPCGIDSVVVCISHLVLLGLCFYQIWLIRNDLKVQRYQLRSKYYNYVLGLLASYCTAEPLFRLVMGISLFNLEGQTGLAPFEIINCLGDVMMVSLIIVALVWCSMLVMLGIETGIYIREFRWYVRFGAAYVLVGDAVMLNLIFSVTDFYTGYVLYMYLITLFIQISDQICWQFMTGKEDGRKAWKSPTGPSEKDNEFFEDKLSSSVAALDNLHNQMKTLSLRFECLEEIVGNCKRELKELSIEKEEREKYFRDEQCKTSNVIEEKDVMIKHLEATVSATRLDMESLNSKMEELHVGLKFKEGMTFKLENFRRDAGERKE
ncbi:ABC transporter C family member 12 [Camellia lanceoleosa]|uniref:ABC transporter C family member 12 n=1 Tax=Camellia lanceoleosa TaxID=1840588 RepID=A0ACC0HM03_9ERIC|nr:ABC transporter C family member 12 [Camellia lanceoleosa]